MIHTKGLTASPGIAIGNIWVHRPLEISTERQTVADPNAERERLQNALATAQSQLQALEEKALAEVGAEEAAIFEFHQMCLQDPDLLELVEQAITEEAVNAEAAVDDAIENYAATLEQSGDEYFAARASDVRDVGRRIVRCLHGVDPNAQPLPDHPVIVVADDLTPSDTMQFDRSVLLGLATVRGGPTSHTAILARSLGIPALVSVSLDLDSVTAETVAVLDGESGTLVLNPSDEALQSAKEEQSLWQSRTSATLAKAMEPAITTDGQPIEVVANIGNAADAATALEFGAEGVGLFRTEFLFLDRDTMPSEAEQVDAYRAVFDVMAQRPVVVRTLDIGGDKAVSYLGLTAEPNPFLGWRAIRMIDERPEILLCQFRALLQAGAQADLRIMLPLVSSIHEIRKAKDLYRQAQESLAAEGKPAASNVQFGIMVEVPAAALCAMQFAPEIDFFSIGTNDLTQYALAVDRMNERVSHLGSPFHPAVLRLIELTARAASAHGKWVGICGAFGGDPRAVPILLGLGVHELSMAPSAIPEVKETIRALSLSACQQIAAEVLTLDSAEAVLDYLSQI